MKENGDAKFKEWMSQLNGNCELDLWREALAHLRQLHGDVWNGVRFFLTVNGVVLAAIFTIFSKQINHIKLITSIGILATLGLIMTIIATKILSKHRDYYLNMLLRKTVIEHELGFYDTSLSDVILSFPWSVDKPYLKSDVLLNPTKWLSEHKWRKKTVSRLLRMTYILFLVIYICILVSLGVSSWLIFCKS